MLREGCAQPGRGMAGQRRSGLPAPPALRRRSPEGLRGAVPVSDFCPRRKEGREEEGSPPSPRLGAAGGFTRPRGAERIEPDRRRAGAAGPSARLMRRGP